MVVIPLEKWVSGVKDERHRNKPTKKSSVGPGESVALLLYKVHPCHQFRGNKSCNSARKEIGKLQGHKKIKASQYLIDAAPHVLIFMAKWI